MNDSRTESQETMTFMEHLEELRRRLIKCLVAVIAGVLVCWFFREELRQFLEAPLYAAWKTVPGLPAPSPLSFTSLMEPFVAYLKIAGIGGVFFASPVIFFHLWRFISPGLYSNEKRMALPFVMISSLLFIVGSAGAYAYVFPLGFSFFLQFSSGGTVESLESAVDTVADVAPVQGMNDESDVDVQKASTQSANALQKKTPVSEASSIQLDSAGDADTASKTAVSSETDSAKRPDSDTGEDSPGHGAKRSGDTAASRRDTAAKQPESRTDLTEKSQPKVEKKSSVPKAGVEKKQPEKEAAMDDDKWERMRRLYSWVEKKLMGDSCGEFNTQVEKEGVRLQYLFSVEQCGRKPLAFHIDRNDIALDLKMQLVAETNQSATWEVLDRTKTGAPVNYRLTVVREAAQKLLPVLMVRDYLDFAVKLLLAFGLVFELPILIFFLAWAGIVDYMQLIRFGRWFVVLSLVVAAILTPPDVITQILLATPLVILYYLSILVVFFMGRKRKQDE